MENTWAIRWSLLPLSPAWLLLINREVWSQLDRGYIPYHQPESSSAGELEAIR